ncbi:transposase [Paenibacillus sp. 2TAB23]|uniref:transposase n=1 Tax=Paenibacillus sp. 2TAB23 TaxID=3233004 RepID=UPI003F978D3A
MGQGKKYDKAFKEQGVLRIMAEESTDSEAAKEIGVHDTTVRDWVKVYKQDELYWRLRCRKCNRNLTCAAA